MSDDWLRSELEALEASAPAALPNPKPRVWRMPMLAAAAGVALILIAVAAALPNILRPIAVNPSSSPSTSNSTAASPSASATAVPTSTAPSVPTPTQSLAENEVLLRVGDDQTVQAVQDIVPFEGEYVAAVNTLHADFVPAVGPSRYSADIYMGSLGGGWRRVETGEAFVDARITALFKPHGGPLVAYGYTSPSEGPERVLQWTSDDGRTWNAHGAPPGWGVSTTVVDGPHGYVAVHNSEDIYGFGIYRSDDAINWALTYEAPADSMTYALDAGAGPEGFVVLARDSDSDRSITLASPDGRTWFASSPDSSPRDFVYAVAPLHADWFAAGFGDGEIRIWRSANGLDWALSSSIADPGGFSFRDSPESVFGVASYFVSSGERLFLSGGLSAEGVESRPRAAWTSTDGENWALLNLGTEPEVRDVATDGLWLLLGVREGDEAGDAVIWRTHESWFP